MYDVKHKKTKSKSFQFKKNPASFQGLKSSLAQSPGELWSCKWREISGADVISEHEYTVRRLPTCSTDKISSRLAWVEFIWR